MMFLYGFTTGIFAVIIAYFAGRLFYDWWTEGRYRNKPFGKEKI